MCKKVAKKFGQSLGNAYLRSQKPSGSRWGRKNEEIMYKKHSVRGCFDFILEPGRREKARKERLERQAVQELGRLAVRAKAAHPDMDALDICQDIERQVTDNGLKEGGVWIR